MRNKSLSSLIICALCLPLLVAAAQPTAAHQAARDGARRDQPNSTRVQKGVALLDWSHMEDLDTLHASLYYGWGEYCGSRPNCLNMVRDWDSLPKACYPTLLLGNEPTNAEPAGHPIEASVAASMTLQIEAACPKTQIIAANIHLNNGDGSDALNWLHAYLAAYKTQAGHAYGGHNLLGLHCYAYDAATCINRVQTLEASLTEYTGHFWITETDIVSFYPDAAQQLQSLLSYYASDPRIDWVFVFTNRTADWLSLVNNDGSLNASGAVYASWTGQSWHTYLPVVANH